MGSLTMFLAILTAFACAFRLLTVLLPLIFATILIFRPMNPHLATPPLLSPSNATCSDSPGIKESSGETNTTGGTARD